MAKVLITQTSLKFLVILYKFMLIMKNIYNHFKCPKEKKISHSQLPVNFFGQSNHCMFQFYNTSISRHRHIFPEQRSKPPHRL